MTKPSPDRRAVLLSNIQAGTTTAVVIIPQGMAYAMVAGLEPIHGLYASLLPLVVYAIIGRSRELAVGPGALDTLLTGAALGGMAFVTPANHAAYAATLALMVAAIQLLLGVMRAGFLVNFLSNPVISGFTSAAAITIGLNQFGNLLGFQLPSSPHAHELFASVAMHLGDIHLATAIIGLASIALLVLGKKHIPRAPYALGVVVLAVIVSSVADLSSSGVRIIGNIPAGLPAVELPPLDAAALLALLPTAFALAFVGYLTIISIARTFADRNGYDISPNRELVATGAANLAAAVTRGFPLSASFSRSAVHAAAGATSPYALLVTATWVALTLLLFTDLLTTLPRATLAAVIITAVQGLIDVKTPKRLWRVKRLDCAILLLTFAATLFVGIEPGILIGVGASIMAFIYTTTRPHWAVLTRLGNSPDFRNIKYHPDQPTVPGLIVLRIDAQLYFANVTFLKALLRQLERESATPLQGVIIEACSLTWLDSSADAALQAIADDYRKRGIRLMFASVKVPVMQVMRASGLYATIGEANFFLNPDAAVRAFESERKATPQP